MPSPDRHFEWRDIWPQSGGQHGAGTPQRLNMLLGLVAAGALVVFLRAVQLELTGGTEFRTLAARPITRTKVVPASRGRILARDGTPLAADTRSRALAVHYRWLEQPVDAAWLRRQALASLTRKERRSPERVREAEAALLARRDQLHRQLMRLCGVSDSEWQSRRSRVQARVGKLVAHVHQRRLERFWSQANDAAHAPPADNWLLAVAQALGELFAPEKPAAPEPVVLAEQLEYYPLVEDLPAEVADEITAAPERFPGAKIVELSERTYPAGTLAAHVVGHLGRGDAGSPADHRDSRELAGRMGIERQNDSVLRGEPGADVERIDHRGKWLGTDRVREPVIGQDVVLTLDPRVQHAAEALLDQACGRSADRSQGAAGGAAVVLDVSTGEVLAAASAPRFDPRTFSVPDGAAIEAILSAPGHPLVDRVSKMALPPGSVFKVITAVALLESRQCEPDEPFFCQGFLHESDRQRCMIFRQQGIGHGDLTLADALARSCNVFFFEHAGELGPEPLLAWARRFGFGRTAGIELPDEAAGNLPASSPDDPRLERLGKAQAIAIGQGQLTATPLQIARAMAAIAKGGRLIQPRLVLKVGTSSDTHGAIDEQSGGDLRGETLRIAPATLAAVREGLRRTVADVEGTAHDAARLGSLSIAGKTGTAQTSGDDHAWFAGYAPAEEPRVAIAVVLEHGGHAARSARICRELLARMQQLGYFEPAGDNTADSEERIALGLTDE